VQFDDKKQLSVSSLLSVYCVLVVCDKTSIGMQEDNIYHMCRKNVVLIQFCVWYFSRCPPTNVVL